LALFACGGSDTETANNEAVSDDPEAITYSGTAGYGQTIVQDSNGQTSTTNKSMQLTIVVSGNNVTIKITEAEQLFDNTVYSTTFNSDGLFTVSLNSSISDGDDVASCSPPFKLIGGYFEGNIVGNITGTATCIERINDEEGSATVTNVGEFRVTPN